MQIHKSQSMLKLTPVETWKVADYYMIVFIDRHGDEYRLITDEPEWVNILPELHHEYRVLESDVWPSGGTWHVCDSCGQWLRGNEHAPYCPYCGYREDEPDYKGIGEKFLQFIKDISVDLKMF